MNICIMAKMTVKGKKCRERDRKRETQRKRGEKGVMAMDVSVE